MQITIKQSVIHEKKIEVEFPIFREHDISSDHESFTRIVYQRIDFIRATSQCRQISVTIIGDNEAEIQIDNNYKFSNCSEDYLLGQGGYACTQEEFEAAIQEAQAILDKAVATIETAS